MEKEEESDSPISHEYLLALSPFQRPSVCLTLSYYTWWKMQISSYQCDAISFHPMMMWGNTIKIDIKVLSKNYATCLCADIIVE